MDTKSTPVSLGADEEKEQRKYPRFVKEDDFCNWCGGLAKLIKVQVEEYQKEEVVMMYYECTSKRCDHQYYYQTPNVYQIYNFGKNAVEQFIKYTSGSQKVVGEA